MTKQSFFTWIFFYDNGQVEFAIKFSLIVGMIYLENFYDAFYGLLRVKITVII